MKELLLDAYIKIDGTVISNNGNEVSVEASRDVKEVTGFGSLFKEKLVGLGDGTITMTVFNDYDAAALDSILWALSQSNTPFTVEVRPTSAARGTGNPAYVMDCLLSTYNPISGQVGEPATTPLSFENATQSGLQRLTA